MNTNLIALTFTAEAQASAAGVFEFQFPRKATIVFMSLCVEAYASSGSSCNIDIQEAGSDVITALTANSAGTPGTWKSTHFGGTETPVTVAALTDIEVDLNLDQGTADFTLVVWALLGEV